MPEPVPIVFILSLAFGLHIALVNLDIGLATLIPIMKRVGERREDEFLVRRAKNLMRYYAMTYAVAGVFGTAFTVALLAFYPAFIGLAGHLTWVPFGLAVLLIALRFLSVAGYWYLWDRVSSGIHLLIGAAMAATGILIPLGFRAVFAFLNAPFGLRLQPKPHLILGEALSNPTLMPLYLKSVFGALSTGLFVVASAYAWRYLRTEGELRERYAGLVKALLPYGTLSLFLMLVFGFWYTLSLLSVSQYKFLNIFGGFLGADPTKDFSWLFLVKMALVAVQFGVILYVLDRLLKGLELDDRPMSWIKTLGPAALGTVITGELLNMYSQLPYFVARPDLFNMLPSWVVSALSVDTVNPLANLPGVYVITGAALTPLLAAVAALIYVATKGEPEDLEGVSRQREEMAAEGGEGQPEVGRTGGDGGSD